MAYTPDPNDASQPTGGVAATTAAAEFRALKGKVNAMALTSGSKLSKRQTVVTGPLLSGVPSAVVISATALGVDLKGGSTAVLMAFASGFNNAGDVDYLQSVGSDLLNFWSALPASNRSFLALDYNDDPDVDSGNPIKYNSLAPPVYDYNFYRNISSLIHFDGANGATTVLDDFGNTWTVQSGAKLQTAQFKFGTAALGGAGGASQLNGSSDFLKSTDFQSLDEGDGFTLEAWVRATTLPGAGTRAMVISHLNAAGFGAELFIDNNAGTIRFGYNISSNGSANNVANGIVGVSTPVVDTWYHVALVKDSISGHFRLYVNGTQENSTASTERVCAVTQSGLGAKPTAASYLTGYIDEYNYSNYCRYPAGNAFVVPAAAYDITAAGFASNFFNIVDMKMYTISAASTAAGSNPTFSAITRLYVGEAEANAAAVSLLRCYAYNGKFVGTWTALTTVNGTVNDVSSNIGTKQQYDKQFQLKNIITDGGWLPGDIIDGVAGYYSATYTMFINHTRNILTWVNSNNSNNLCVNNKTSGANHSITNANWLWRLSCERSF